MSLAFVRKDVGMLKTCAQNFIFNSLVMYKKFCLLHYRLRIEDFAHVLKLFQFEYDGTD